MYLKPCVPGIISLFLFILKNVSIFNALSVEKSEETSVNNKKCGPEKWLCSNSSICVSLSNLCDGYVDCQNGDDESNTLCTTVSNSHFDCTIPILKIIEGIIKISYIIIP